MTNENLITFDSTVARTYSPKRVLKRAKMMEAEPGEKTVIEPSWGGTQTFEGNWVAVLNDDDSVQYGSAYDEWMNTNTRWPEMGDDAWYKSTCVSAHPSPRDGMLEPTMIGDVEEVPPRAITTDDWIVRQLDGEIMAMSSSSFAEKYEEVV